MLKTLFSKIASRSYREQAKSFSRELGLAPIAMALPESRFNDRKLFWKEECSYRPSQIACLTYED